MAHLRHCCSRDGAHGPINLLQHPARYPCCLSTSIVSLLESHIVCRVFPALQAAEIRSVLNSSFFRSGQLIGTANHIRITHQASYSPNLQNPDTSRYQDLFSALLIYGMKNFESAIANLTSRNVFIPQFSNALFHTGLPKFICGRTTTGL